MQKYRQVLKYPGSKWLLARKLVDFVPEHHTYCEPFAGSMAMLFSKEPSPIEIVNDLDSEVVNLFQCIQQDSERLARLLLTTPYSREVYDQQFDSYHGYASRYQRAAGFLIRCWQGHGFRQTGVKVGWKNDVQGREKMYALWNWYRLPEWVVEVAERLRMVQIESRPALEVIERFDFDNVFMYLDPPYLLETRRARQYAHEMSETDHKELLQVITHSKAKIMISGYASDMYDDYLREWIRMEFRGSAEHGGTRQEVVWMNYSLEKEGQMSIEDFLHD